MKKTTVVLCLLALFAPSREAAAQMAMLKPAKLVTCTKAADAVKAAKKAEKPILIYFAPKESKTDAEFKDRVFNNRLFMHDFVARNFVLFKCVPKIDMNGNAQTIVGLSTNDQAAVNLGFQGTDKMWGYGFAILDSAAAKAICRAGYGGLAQPKEDLSLTAWWEILISMCESKSIDLELSPAVKKYLEKKSPEKSEKKRRK
jgi:hypothetical protein